jgi:hypothetical protein
VAALIRLLEHAVRERSRWIFLGFAIVGAAAGLACLQIRIDTSVERMLIRGDPERELNRTRRAEFSNDEIIVAAFDLGRPFTADDLRRLRVLSESVADLEGIEEVIDITNIEDVRSSGDLLDASVLVDFEGLDGSLVPLYERVSGHRLYDQNLASDDLQVLSMSILLELVESYD